MSVADYPSVQPKSVAEWGRWLRDHHETARGVWLVSFKRSSGKQHVDYEDQVREALRWGWIDSLLRPIDRERGRLLYTPRRPGSGWSRTNKARVNALIAEGRMRPAGLAKIEAAKKDGSWTLLDSVDALSPSVRRQHLFSLVTAKKPETRAKRIAAVVRLMRG